MARPDQTRVPAPLRAPISFNWARPRQPRPCGRGAAAGTGAPASGEGVVMGVAFQADAKTRGARRFAALPAECRRLSASYGGSKVETLVYSSVSIVTRVAIA